MEARKRSNMSEQENTKETVTKSALVTGSSRGIGRAIATALAQQGYDVCINCASEGSLVEAEGLARELEERWGVKTLAVRADISIYKESQALIDQVKQFFGRIDILVNNAGITRDGLLARMKEEDFDDVISINLKGTFNCSRAAVPYMMKQRYGRIVNMGSVVGMSGNAGQVNYAASKAGVIGLSKSLAREVAPRNITVNVVAPGFIDTDMTQALSEKQQNAILERIACRRYGTPEDVASLVTFLASEQAGYITGQTIGIDGGMAL